MTAVELPRALRAFGYRDFRWFFTGGLVSSIGTNMQVAALAWVVQAHSHRAALTTAIAFVGMIPLLVLSPAGGVLADRFERRRLLIWSNSALGVLAVFLWLVFVAGLDDQYWLLFTISLVGGIVTALQTPAWQSLPAQLVERVDLPNAITLNTTQFNLARALGPLAAGFTIDSLGAGGAFFANACSYVVIIGALLAMRSRVPSVAPNDGLSTTQRWLAGVRYARERPALVLVISLHFVFAFLGPPVVYIVPKLAQDVLHIGAGEYGVLLGTFGIGAIIAAVGFGASDHRVQQSRLLVVGFSSGAIGFLGLGLAHALPLAIVAMTAYGACYVVVVSVHHGAIQRLTDDAHRGRVVSLWLMTFGLAMPCGLLVQGALADHLGVSWVLRADGIGMLVTIVAVALSGQLRHLD